MSTTYILIGLAPILLFALVDWRWGPRYAAITVVVTAVLLVFYDYVQFAVWDGTLLAEAALVIVLALVSMAKDDPLFFKLQPAVTGVALALFLTWFQVFDQPYLLKILPRITSLSPNLASLAEIPAFRAMLARVSLQLIALLLAHASIMAYSAIRQSRRSWVLWRLAIYPAILVLMMVNQISM